jgi:hypothetical protein
MHRFDRRAALWTFLAELFLLGLSSWFAGLKECGPVPWSIVFFPMALIVFVKLPWSLPLLALIAVLIGLLWPRKMIYGTIVKIVFVIALIVAPAVTFIMVPSSGMPCDAV